MLTDKLGKMETEKIQRACCNVQEIFENKKPYMDFGFLYSKSIRNRLLAYYLTESLPGEVVRAMVEKDTGKNLVYKICLADESYLLRPSKIIRLGRIIPYANQDSYIPLNDNEEAIREIDGKDNESGKRGNNINYLYPHSTLEKYIVVFGIHFFNPENKPYRNPKLNTEPIIDNIKSENFNEQKMKSEKLAEVLFKFDSSAEPDYAAACYVQLLQDEKDVPYLDAVLRAKNPGHLRKILCFKAYHSRNRDSKLSEENIVVLKRDIDEAFLVSLKNWNKDMLNRLLI